MPGLHAPTVHQLKIGLEGAAPPLWRRIQVPSAASLGFLHSVIQEAFGWEGFHLHCFRDERGHEWGEPESPDGLGYPAATFADEEEAGLGKILRAEGAVLWYVYDFGDDWRHRIEVEKIMPLDPDVTYPRCTGGRRAAPPAEDIGGIWGLEEVVYLVAHPEADPPENFEDLVSHLRATGYDPATFDPAELTGRLSGLNMRTAAEAADEGHTARVAGELAAADATALLDALPYDDPAAFSAELTGWLAGRDMASAVTQMLDAVPGTDPELAGRRVIAIRALTMAQPNDVLEILRDAAASGPDGRRHVAAGVLANLGEESPFYRETAQQWLLIDLLTAFSADDLRGLLTQDLLEAIAAHADDLWRSGHPAAAETMEATAAALRDSDKTLAKRLRRSAHKARGRLQVRKVRVFGPLSGNADEPNALLVSFLPARKRIRLGRGPWRVWRLRPVVTMRPGRLDETPQTSGFQLL